MIQGPGGLVTQQEPGPADQGTGDGDPLLFAAGQLGREVVDAVAQPDQAEGLHDRIAGDLSAATFTFSTAVRVGTRL